MSKHIVMSDVLEVRLFASKFVVLLNSENSCMKSCEVYRYIRPIE